MSFAGRPELSSHVLSRFLEGSDARAFGAEPYFRAREIVVRMSRRLILRTRSVSESWECLLARNRFDAAILEILRLMFTLERNRVSFSEGHSSGAIPMGVKLGTKLHLRDRANARQNEPVSSLIPLREYTPKDILIPSARPGLTFSACTFLRKENAREFDLASEAAGLELRPTKKACSLHEKYALAMRQKSHEFFEISSGNLLPSPAYV